MPSHLLNLKNVRDLKATLLVPTRCLGRSTSIDHWSDVGQCRLFVDQPKKLNKQTANVNQVTYFNQHHSAPVSTRSQLNQQPANGTSEGTTQHHGTTPTTQPAVNQQPKPTEANTSPFGRTVAVSSKKLPASSGPFPTRPTARSCRVPRCVRGTRSSVRLPGEIPTTWTSPPVTG